VRISAGRKSGGETSRSSDSLVPAVRLLAVNAPNADPKQQRQGRATYTGNRDGSLQTLSVMWSKIAAQKNFALRN